jgi:purine catabolism regulator
MRTTVRHIFENCLEDQGTVVAGENGLTRVVTKITVSELEDAAAWFQGGEIVCSTGAVLVDNPELQKTWIADMSRCGVAGVILKPDRFLGEIPPTMIEAANRYDLPIITVPLDTVWPNIIDSIVNMMTDIQTESLRNSFKIHNDLTNLVLSSRPVSDVVSMLSKMSSCPIILEDQYFNALHYSCGGSAKSCEYTKMRLAPGYQEKLRTLLSGKKGRKTPRELLTYLPSAFNEKPMLMMPIIAGKHFFGWLTLLALREEDDIISCKTILNHGSTVVALSLLNDYTNFVSSEQENAHFVRFLSGEIPISDKNFHKASALLGIDLESPTIIITIEIRADVTPHCFDALKGVMQSFDPDAVTLLSKNRIVILFHPSHNLSQSLATNEAKKAIRTASIFFGCEDYEWSAGVSNLHSTQNSIMRGYSESIMCLNKAIKDNGDIVVAANLGLENFFSLVSDKDKLSELSYHTLEKILAYDEKYNTEFTPTLWTYLKSRYNKALAARELNIHLNTLSYRLERIREIMEIDIEDAETCALLVIAIKIRNGGLC